jgi:hypothetical protein
VAAAAWLGRETTNTLMAGHCREEKEHTTQKSKERRRMWRETERTKKHSKGLGKLAVAARLLRAEASGAATLAQYHEWKMGRAFVLGWRATNRMDSQQEVEMRPQDSQQKSTPKIKFSDPKQGD